MVMAYEYTPPKYAQLIEELQRRIESGEYPPGSMLPSEHQLTAEFGMARPTVVRALRTLRGDGWISTQQGKGSFVRGRPALADVASQRRGVNELDRDEAREHGELVEVGMISPPPRIATLLDVSDDAKVLRRTRLVRWDGEPAEVVTWWIPAPLAKSTELAEGELLHGGVRAHLARHGGTRIDHVVEQVVARHPSPAEVKLLGVHRTAPILSVYATAREASGKPVLVLDIAMPGDRQELEDAYQVS
jgi:DNA-binding GntR family transcriptional regulator